MTSRFFIVSSLCGLLLLVAGCSPRGAEEAVPLEAGIAPTEPAEVVQVETATPDAVEIMTATPASESAGDEETSAAEFSGDVITVEAAASIEQFRQRVHVMSQSARGVDTVDMETATIKDPPAQHNVITFQQGEGDDATRQQLEFVYVDGMSYIQIDNTWVQNPDSPLNIRELTLIAPEDVVDLTGQMEQVGEEEVEGRAAIHYRGDKTIIPVVGTAGDTLDVSQIDQAQLDLWVDQELGALIRLELSGSDGGNGEEVSFSVSIVYHDLNGDIIITPPANVEMADGESPAAETDTEPATPPRNEVSALLGYDFLLPTGSSVQLVEGDNLVVVSTPYTMDEAARLIESNLPANGYELVNQAGSSTDEMLYIFQQGEHVVTIVISPDQAGGGVILQFAAQ